MKGGRTTRRPAGCRLAHRRARRLDDRGRRALPAGRRDPGRHARGAVRRRRAALAPAASAGRRVAVLTNAGGLGILCADACEAAGLELPPLAEETRDAARAPSCRARRASRTRSTCSARPSGSTYEAVLPHVLADPGIDAVIVLFVPPVVAGAEEVAEAVVRGVRSTPRTDKPVLAAFVAADGRPACLAPSEAPASPRSSTRSRLPARWAMPPTAPNGCAGRRDRSPTSTASTVAAAEALVASVLGRLQRRLARRRLRCASCSAPTASRSWRSGSRDAAEDAVEAARELGLPVVVKTRGRRARTRRRPAASHSTSRPRRTSGPAVERIGAARA